jgi:hypothetical protein
MLLAILAGTVIINEVAWMGTAASANEEWIELKNTTNNSIILDNWKLAAEDNSPSINLKGIINANSFYVLKRTTDYKGALENTGENLRLYDSNNNLIDEIVCQDQWPAGDNETKQTMERNSTGWQTSAPAGGTMGAENGKPEVTKAKPTSTPKPKEIKTAAKAEVELVAQNSEIIDLASEKAKPPILLIAVVVALFSGATLLFLKNRLESR